jgi:hypothetical protein
VQQKEVQQHVNVLYRWEWRSDDGTYEAFDEGQCIKIETAYRTGLGVCVRFLLRRCHLKMYKGEG